MDFLAGGKRSAAGSEGPWRDGKELPPSLLIGHSSLHVFPQHLTHQTGYARLLLGSLDPHPESHLFFQGDGDVSHAHEVSGTRGSCQLAGISTALRWVFDSVAS